MQGECRFCGKLKKNVRAHERFCVVNPDRVRGKKNSNEPTPMESSFVHPATEATSPNIDILSLLGDSGPSLMAQLDERIDRRLQERAEAALAKGIDKMGAELLNQLPKMVDQMITSRMDQFAGSIQNQIGDVGPKRQQQTGERSQIADTLASAFAQKMMGGGGGGGTDLKSLMEQMAMVQSLGTMFQAPMLTGMKVMADMLSASIKAGATPEGASKAASQVISALTPPTKAQEG